MNLWIEILLLIKEEKTLNQIMKELNIDEKILLENLKIILQNGYHFDKKYFSDGNISYLLKKNDEVLHSFKKIDELDEKFRVIFISDLHLGHKKDGLKLLDRVYEYAIKNNIHIIINGGDLLENTYAVNKKYLKRKTIESQLDYVIKNHPFDKNLINFILYGNHDYYSLKNNGLNVAKLIEQERYDLVSLGYNRSYIGLKNDWIIISHDCKVPIDRTIEHFSQICFSGHSHKYKTLVKNKKEIFIPTLSSVYPSNYILNPLSGFLDVEFSFNKRDLISKAYIKQFTYYYGLNLSSESELTLRKTK